MYHWALTIPIRVKHWKYWLGLSYALTIRIRVKHWKDWLGFIVSTTPKTEWLTLNFNCTVHVIIRVHQVPVPFAYYGEPKWNYMLLVHFDGSQFSQGIISIYRYLSFELCCRSRDHNYYVHCLLRLTLTYPTKRIRLTKEIWFYDYTCYSRFEACRSSSRVRSVQPPPFLLPREKEDQMRI